MGKKVWTDMDTKFLIENRDKLSNADIAERLSCSPKTICSRVQSLNLPRHKISAFSCNSNYFDELNLETSYFGGFIAADGCIYSRYKQLSFELQIRDYRQLLKFASATEFNGKIYLKERPNKGWSSQLYICNERWVEKLKEHFNIVPKKSLTLEAPNIVDLPLGLAYAVGYIDGDGTIGCYKATYNGRMDWTISINGTLGVLSYIKNLFDPIVPSTGKVAKVVNVRRDGKVYDNRFCYQIKGKRAEALLKILINVDCPHLDRKWDKIRGVLI